MTETEASDAAGTAPGGGDWDQQYSESEGSWVSIHRATGQKLRFDDQTQNWVNIVDNGAPESSTTAAAEPKNPDADDEERKKYTRCLDGLWIYREPSTRQVCYYHSTLNQWVPLATVATSSSNAASTSTPAVKTTNPTKKSDDQEMENDSDEDGAKTPEVLLNDQSKTPPLENSKDTRINRENDDGGDDDDDFAFQLKQQQQQTTTSTDGGSTAVAAVTNRIVHPVSGAEYEWSEETNEWQPLVDDDFIARYQMSYGVQHDDDVIKASVSSLPKMMEFEANNGGSSDDEQKESEKERADREEKEKLAAMTPMEKKAYIKEKKKKAKLEAAEREKNKGWFELENTENRNVYVSNLPSTISDQEFEELMAKCGVIDLDPATRKTKVKLYKTETGESKGDGRCCYVKRESVDLALQILDGSDVNGNRIAVQVAQFEMKGGEFDRTKRKKKLTAKQKQKFKEQQQKLFDWRPEKLIGERGKHEKTVILKNVFCLEELDKNAALLLEIEELLKAEAVKYGKLRKLIMYDTNPEGVVSLTYDSHQEADDCITMMNYRVFRKRQVRAEIWDGKTKYKMAESKESEETRAKAWEEFLEGSSSEEEGDDDKDEDKNTERVELKKRKIGNLLEDSEEGVPKKKRQFRDEDEELERSDDDDE